MPELLTLFGSRGITIFIVLLIVLGTIGTLVLLLNGPWWPSVMFQAGQRPQIYRSWLFWTGGTAIVLGYIAFGTAGVAMATTIWIIFAPRFIVARATKTAWKADEPPKRAAALAVRNRIRRGANEAEYAGSECWDQYVLDSARAERQARYQPPGS
ncbi:MAG TPA: hypothetical protein VF503_15350 [Sphingobium sp.]|uniref:hypothetical protein n=1 Tax=Sphingobium sp. TaxID=1912891 RepID=UPI002ED0063F